MNSSETNFDTNIANTLLMIRDFKRGISKKFIEPFVAEFQPTSEVEVDNVNDDTVPAIENKPVVLEVVNEEIIEPVDEVTVAVESELAENEPVEEVVSPIEMPDDNDNHSLDNATAQDYTEVDSFSLEKEELGAEKGIEKTDIEKEVQDEPESFNFDIAETFNPEPSDAVSGVSGVEGVGGALESESGFDFESMGDVGGAGLEQDRDSGDAQLADLSLEPQSGVASTLEEFERAYSEVSSDDESIGNAATLDYEIPSGLKSKFTQNIKAINALDLDVLSDEARSELTRYSGWGGLSNAFYKPDGSVAKGWASEARALEGLLSAEDYASARRSTQNSHYTPSSIISAIWEGVEQMGFEGGDVLEPSMGVGGFIGLSPVRSKLNVTGIELDGISARISKALYPDSSIIQGGFQHFHKDDKSFDLVIGNPPFGQTTVFDSERKHLNTLAIHNYFFAKSNALLREGGIMAMVTSKFFMDSKDDKARALIARDSNLIGAARLPEEAFYGTANTNITTDILFFQKRTPDMVSNFSEWSKLGEHNGHDLNIYFEDNPENLLGEWTERMSQRGEITVLKDTGDFEGKLKGFIQRLPAGIVIDQVSSDSMSTSSTDTSPTSTPLTTEVTDKYTPVAVSDEEFEEALKDSLEALDNEFFLSGDKVFLRERSVSESRPNIAHIDFKINSKDEKVSLTEREVTRLKGMVEIASIAKSLRVVQLDADATEIDIETLRYELNVKYDEFVKKEGFLSSRVNKSLFSRDINAFYMLSLESNYDIGVSSAVAKTTGGTTRKASADKADIFSKRTQSPYTKPTKADSVEDALAISLSEYSEVDIEYMAQLTGLEEDDVIENLSSKQLIFKDDGVWVVRNKFLSGNIREKLARAVDAAHHEALLDVMPTDIEPIDISANLGANWIDEEYYNEFVREITGDTTAKVQFIENNSRWEIEATDSFDAKMKFGTERRLPSDLLVSLMSNKSLQVFDSIDLPGGKTSRVLNKMQSDLALQKGGLITQEFKSWIWMDPERRDKLSKKYNEIFNNYAKPVFDGSHLELQGKVSDESFEFRPHQKNGVWRVLQGGTTLFDHVVGTGKTATTVGSVMELRRTGKSKKPLIVVPNHLVEQWAHDFLSIYPNANILVPEKKDFAAKHRKVLMNRMATGDYDAVILAHSQLTKISNDPITEAKIIEREIETLNELISKSNNSFSVKRAESKKDSLINSLEKLLDLEQDKDNINFSQIGFDSMFLDEAHEFKNLAYETGMSNVGGLGSPAGSKKAFDLYIKTQTLLDNTGGNYLVFLTGTPISNTIAEMYTLQRYLARDELKFMGLQNFDSWVNTFAEVVDDWELSATGEYRLKSRLAKFNNMPELISIYQQFSDVVTREDINKQLALIGKSLPVPKMKTGVPINVIAPKSDEQDEYIGVRHSDGTYTQGSLIERAESGTDIMLKIISDARKCALDMRIIDPLLDDYADSKVNMALNRSLELYHEFDSVKGTQLVFCDLSTPKGTQAKERDILLDLVERSNEGCEDSQRQLDLYSQDDIDVLMALFSVYDDMKAKYIKAGIPEHEIAFIHDANTDIKKARLHANVNSGKVRILIGSTMKMGAGMNVQERLVALHHLDAPWRPSDLEQREGRIIRQGNVLMHSIKDFEVEVNRYATKGTLDSMMWQIIEGKARFVEQIRSGAVTDRVVEDIGQSTSAAEMKAASSGNPLILEEMKLRTEVKKLESLRDGFSRRQHALEGRLKVNSFFVEKTLEMKVGHTTDIQTVKDNLPESLEGFEARLFIDGEVKEYTTVVEKDLLDLADEGLLEGPSNIEASNAEPVTAAEEGENTTLIKEMMARNSINTDYGKGREGYKAPSKIHVRTEFGQEVKRLLAKAGNGEIVMGEMAGFKLIASGKRPFDQDFGTVIIEGALRHEVVIPGGTSLIGISARMFNRLNGLEKSLDIRVKDSAVREKEIPTIVEALKERFTEEERLEELKKEYNEVISALRGDDNNNDNESDNSLSMS